MNLLILMRILIFSNFSVLKCTYVLHIMYLTTVKLRGNPYSSYVYFCSNETFV